MYHPELIERNLHSATKSTNTTITRHSVSRSQAFSKRITNLLSPDTGQLTRDLTAEELSFIQSEILLCKFDFRYWHDRYCWMFRDGAVGGGTGPSPLWVSQENLLSLMAETEMTNHIRHSEGYPTFGIRVADHKARQLGHTHVARALSMHRLTLWASVRSMAASVNDDKVMELYDRDKLILDHLPFFLRPSLDKGNFFENKNEHMQFKSLKNRILYQQANQMSGLGQGRQFEVSHLTEVSSYPYPRMLELDFFPTMPDAPSTLSVLESTAQARGDWWHDFTEQVRKGEYIGWVYCFTPWYIEPKKYRAHPPDDWNPSEHTTRS